MTKFLALSIIVLPVFKRMHSEKVSPFIKDKSWSASTPRRQYLCIHHSKQTQNDRGLEEEASKDSDGENTSRRQRNGVVNQK